MKRLFTILIFFLTMVILGACGGQNGPEENIIAVAQLSERENAILSTTAGQSFVFDFNVNGYKEASVWVEKYESGKLVNDNIGGIKSDIKENGSIIFATSINGDDQNQQVFQIGISSSGGVSSIDNFDMISDDKFDQMASVSGNPQSVTIADEGAIVLASICYSEAQRSMSSLTTDFYTDMEAHKSELEKYDVVYLLRAEFIK